MEIAEEERLESYFMRVEEYVVCPVISNDEWHEMCALELPGRASEVCAGSNLEAQKHSQGN